MNERKKAIAIQLTAAALAVIAAFGFVFYARARAERNIGGDTTAVTEPAPDDGTSTAPLPDTSYPEVTTAPDTPGTEPPAPEPPDYAAALDGVPLAADLRRDGKSVYKGIYAPGSCTLALASAGDGLPDEYSISEGPVRTVVREEAGGAAYYYSEKLEAGRIPALTPYFGYILYNDGSSVRLLDAQGGTLMQNISDYAPTGYRDLSGHPLFKKDGSYYYYYDGSDAGPAAVVADRVTWNDVWQYPAGVFPGAYGDVDDYSEITPTLPETAGMVECTVDENYFNGIAVNSSYETSARSDIFRFCFHKVLKTVTNQQEIDARNAEIAAYRAAVAAGTADPSAAEPAPIEPVYLEEDLGFFWGYLTSEGDYLLEPQYDRAYGFGADGLAFISDPEAPDKGRIVAVDASGTVRINAYKSVFYNVELGNIRVRDGHYLPDTFGAENTGMLTFDHGLALVRRRVAVAAGGRVLSESNALVNTKGQLFNIPGGYEILAYSDGVILLSRNGKYGYMDYTGRWIVQPELTYASPFCEGLAAAGHADGQVGMIDREGNTVLPTVFDRVSDCSDGVVAAWKEGSGWTVFNKMSAEIYEEPVHPVLQIKKRLLAEKAYTAYITENGLPDGRTPAGQ